MSQFLGTMGESIPTDIIHILNPKKSEVSDVEVDASSVPTAPSDHNRRRRHSYHHYPRTQSPDSLSFPSTSTSAERACHKNRSNSLNAVDGSKSLQKDKIQVAMPQVWIRVPESDLTTVWTALSGFSTSLDTGNYGVIDAGIRVVRASRYLMSTTGPVRNKW